MLINDFNGGMITLNIVLVSSGTESADYGFISAVDYGQM